jgi:hypothetical protein
MAFEIICKNYSHALRSIKLILNAFRYQVPLDENQQITKTERLGSCSYIAYVVRGGVNLPGRSTDRKVTNACYNRK